MRTLLKLDIELIEGTYHIKRNMVSFVLVIYNIEALQNSKLLYNKNNLECDFKYSEVIIMVIPQER
jgi:hypothetical protein